MSLNVFGPMPPADLPPDVDPWCCISAAHGGRCICWEPVYDVDQAEPEPGAMTVADFAMCEGCAYRPGTPADDWRKETDEPGRAALFFCHLGGRRLIAWRHPESTLPPVPHNPDEPGTPGEFAPPLVDGVPYRADGTPAPICGGWLARQRR